MERKDVFGDFENHDTIRALLYFLSDRDLRMFANINSVFKQLVEEFRQKQLGRAYVWDGPGETVIKQVSTLQNIARASFGESYAAFLLQDGTVYASGQLNEIPVSIPMLHPIIQVSCGTSHTAFLSREGMAYTCGNGLFGKLGDGNTNYHLVTSPVLVETLQDIVQVSCGHKHTAFVSNGMPYTCGISENGRLGNARIDDHRVGVLTQVPNLRNIIQASCGHEHTAFLSAEGTVYTCGNGSYGRLGNGNIHSHNVAIPTLIPTLRNIAAVSCGNWVTAFLSRTGTAYMCGADTGVPEHIPNLQNIVQISCGCAHCVFMLADGTVYTQDGNLIFKNAVNVSAGTYRTGFVQRTYSQFV